MKQKLLRIKCCSSRLILMLGILFMSVSTTYSQEYAGDEIMKYIVVWDNDGGCVSFALEENPRFEYDVYAMLVNCITSKQRVDIPLNEIHKYILDVNPGIPASIDEAVSEENKMSYGGDVVFLNNFTPDTDVLVFTADGVITARYKTDVNGCLVISTEGWTSGVHVIKANKVSYKIYKK